jgi:hypothetical protein
MRASRWISVSWPPIRTQNVEAHLRGRTRNNGATAPGVICHRALQNQARRPVLFEFVVRILLRMEGYTEVQWSPHCSSLQLPRSRVRKLIK